MGKGIYVIKQADSCRCGEVVKKSSFAGLMLILAGVVLLLVTALLMSNGVGGDRGAQGSGSLMSLAGICSILAGSAVLMRNYMVLYADKVRDEVEVPGGVCRSRSLSRHKCVIKVNDVAREVLKSVIATLRTLGYEVVGEISGSVAIMRKRPEGVVPLRYGGKEVTVLVNAREVRPGLTELVMDYEISGLLAAGALDLADIAREVSRIIKDVRGGA
ncbi:MAG: hypothetical protein J7J20_01535 [Desulfurococcales archaeon]|nr:hypothetical protein [Desulfurococcales archaeon]